MGTGVAVAIELPALPAAAPEQELPGQPVLDTLGLGGEPVFEAPFPLPVPMPELPLVDFADPAIAQEAHVPTAVPPQYREIVARAGRTCPEITPSLIAAQVAVESTWNPRATSRSGAQALAQFVPSTWAAYGVDGNGDGHRNPFDPSDAIAAQAAHMCQLVGSVRHERIPGDAVDNALAAYNAGFGAVLKHQGIPPYAETRAYVVTVRSLAARYDAERAS